MTNMYPRGEKVDRNRRIVYEVLFEKKSTVDLAKKYGVAPTVIFMALQKKCRKLNPRLYDSGIFLIRKSVLTAKTPGLDFLRTHRFEFMNKDERNKARMLPVTTNENKVMKKRVGKERFNQREKSEILYAILFKDRTVKEEAEKHGVDGKTIFRLLHRMCKFECAELYEIGLRKKEKASGRTAKTPGLKFLRENNLLFMNVKNSRTVEAEKEEAKHRKAGFDVPPGFKLFEPPDESSHTISTQKKISSILEHGDATPTIEYTVLIWKSYQKGMIFVRPEDISLLSWVFNIQAKLRERYEQPNTISYGVFNEVETSMVKVNKLLRDIYVHGIQYAMLLKAEGIIK